MIKILDFYQKLSFALSFLLNKKFNEIQLVKKHIANSPILFDVGSNLGNYSNFITNKLKKFNLEIHSFEPIESLYEKQKNLKTRSNHKIVLNNFAIYNSNEEIEFFENSIPSQSSVLNDNQLGKVKKSYLVNAMKLDTYCLKNSINEIGFIKIDVEGSELSVLQSANNLLKYKKINLLKVEISNSQNNFYEIINFMKNFDYKIASIDNMFFKSNYLEILELYFEKC